MKTKDLTQYAVGTALVFVATYAVKFQFPFAGDGGLVHLGNVPLIAIAILLGKEKGMVAGAAGMTIFDLLSNFAVWAPGTFIARALMGFLIGYLYVKFKNNRKLQLFSIITIPSLTMISVYYLYEVIFITRNWIQPLTSVSGNITQLAIGYVLALPIVKALENHPQFRSVSYEK